MADRVLTYVRSVLAGDVQGDVAVGHYLLDTLSTTAAGIEKGKLEGLFNVHLQIRLYELSFIHLLMVALQDTLMISYLSNLVGSQLEMSLRLALVN